MGAPLGNKNGLGNGGGRPSLFNQELADTVCERLVNGESLRRICSDDSMPSMFTVLKWSRDSVEFSTQYARARELQAELFAQDIIDISDDKEDHPLSRKIRVESRQWVVSRILRRLYGDKQVVTIEDPEEVLARTLGLKKEDIP